MTELDLVIKTVSGDGIKPFLSDIARLRITVFREFPYLYDGSAEYEQRYLETYVQSANSLAVLVMAGLNVVGVSTGIPLADETEEFQRPFLDRGSDPSGIFYCGESLLLPEYRGKGIYKSFFREREEHARRLKQFNKICFCAVVRPDDHPLKPDSYRPLDSIWESFGYRKTTGFTMAYSWKDIDKKQEDEKRMVFWMKDL